jgi:serine/threonine-protein kinase
LTPARWRRVEELVESALNLKPEARDSFLGEACGSDEELLREVRSLLACEKRAERILAVPAGQLPPGTQIGPYRVMEVLGAGGMGVVYRAKDTRLDRDVALKLLPAPSLRDPQAMKRFTREAKAASALNHPNICTLHDVGEYEQQPYLVMELVEGESLRSRLTAGRLALEEVLDLALQVADALDTAHAKGIIHRDIKPANVMLNTRGQAKILDFGLAKPLADVGQRLEAPVGPDAETVLLPEQSMTLPGAVMGTAAYMSPEQALGREVDTRTDVFSFGVLVYEMVTGNKAFLGESVQATLKAVVEKDPAPPRGLAAGLPLELEDLILRCLKKEPTQRIQTMAEVRRELVGVQQRMAAPPVAEKPRLSAGMRLWLLAGLAGVALAVAGWGLYMRSRGAPEGYSLAVLPFANESMDPASEYLSDGVTENLINSLSKLEEVKVLARSAVFRYKGRQVDPATVQRELGVVLVLTGSLLRRGELLRVAAELVDARDNSRVWGGQYSRGPDELVAVQEEITRGVIGKLRPKLTEPEVRRLARRNTQKPEAHDLYLRGRYAWNLRTELSMRQSVELYEKALGEDPAYAQAWAGLADSYTMLAAYGAVPRLEVYPRAKAAAERALELDSELAGAHACLARVKTEYEWDWDGADKEYLRAIRLDPNYGTAHHWYAIHLAVMGRHRESITHGRLARQLEPLSKTHSISPGWMLYYARQYQQAEEEFRKVIDADPSFAWGHNGLGSVLLQTGRHTEALAELERGLASSQDGVIERTYLAHACAVKGDAAGARKRLDELFSLAQTRFVPPEYIAFIYVGLGDKRLALKWLEKAHTERSMHTWFLPDPRLDPLRTEPGFQDLMRRMGLRR